MKKIYLLLFLLFSGIGFAQINLTGDSYYKLNISGYQSRDNDACGDIDGLRRIRATRQDGTIYPIFEGRKLNDNVDHEVTFTKNNPFVSVEFYKVVRWETTFGCNGGPNHNYNTVNITSKCFSSYQENSGSELLRLNVSTKPYVSITPSATPLYLGNSENIKIALLDNLDSSSYDWKYRVAGGAERTIPYPYNYKSVLDIKGGDFLTDADYGKTVSIYVKMNCTAGGEQAKGYAQREAYNRALQCANNCTGSIFVRLACMRACETKINQFYNEIYTADLINQFQSINSNAISFTYLKSAPSVNSIAALNPTCYDSSDSSLEIKFSRPLVADKEKLNIILTNTDQGDQLSNYLEIALDANDTYKITNLDAGRYKLQLNGFYEGAPIYSSTILNPLTFEIKKTPVLDFTVDTKNILCKGANNGQITINVTGGTQDTGGYNYYSLDSGNSWVPFSNSGSGVINNVLPGTYNIMVKDMNGCIAKLQSIQNGEIKLGAVKTITKEIIEPEKSLLITLTQEKDPTFFGAENGRIVAAISGGTPKSNKTYNYQWLNDKGDELSATGNYNSVTDTYILELDNVPEGQYKLIVKDENYNTAPNKTGCTIETTSTLIAPKTIKITLEIKPISCNSENLGDIDPSNTASATDGGFIAKITGGKKLDPTKNNGIPYYFHWKKQNTNGDWDDLEHLKDSIATGLSKGVYSLNVTDANGISQGTFSNLIQLSEVATQDTLVEPAAMKVEFDKKDVSCFDGENGSVKASIKNGRSGYKYKWYLPESKTSTSDLITGLKKGTYYVEVTDISKGCFVRDSILIEGPKAPLKLTYSEKTPPTFAGASDGVIVAVIEGGTSDGGRYNYVWKNNKDEVLTATEVISPDKFTIRLEGLPEGIYTLSVTDKNYDEPNGQIVNCSKLNDEVELTEPKPLKVTFTRKEISCNSENEFGDEKDNNPSDGKRDESQDGVLIAHVTGGVTLKAEDNNGLPYYYTWKKQNENGIWETLAIKDSIAPNLSYGNYAFNVKDRNHVILGTYTNGAWVAKDSIQFMQEPPKLSVSITKGDVFCFWGNDGWAEAKVIGGTLPYTYAWSNDEDLDDPKNTFLKKGKYTLLITDGRGCTAYDEIDIKEPTAALSIEYKETLNPSFYKATNGKIVVEVKGGTIYTDNRYWFEWKNSKGIVQTSVTTSFNNDIYTISLNGVPEETYTLTVRDANYDAATNKATCTVLNSEITLDDPDPLEVSFEVVRSISCNVNNEFGNETDLSPLDGQRDESQDGILVARVKGGIQLEESKNNGLPYYYTWKKLQKDKTWAIWNDQDETAENLSDGTYALNVKDANNIVLGTYINNILVEEKDAVQDMPEPAKLILTFTKLDVGCSTGDDGWAEAHVSGGTEPYTYEWTNGSDKPKIEGLTTNNYFVKITDGRGCVVQGSIFVGDPNGIFTTEEVKNPTCYKGNDGSIELNVTGGNLPYTYEWNTGATTKDLTGLIEGNYEVTITCPDCCVYKKRFTLKDPSQIVVDLGKDRTLCSDQVLDLDASISDEKAEYVWSSSNGFTSNEAKVSLTKAGTYHVKVISGLGCIAEDEIVIKTTQTAISSEFLLSSQAYLDEEVILVNTSEPFGESTEWILPKGVTIVEQKEKYITLKFDQIGSYTIGLQQTQGECFAVFNKNITVEKRSTLPNADATSKFIVDFIVTPNPSNGNFKALVNLENNSAINLRLFSGTGQFTTIQKKDSGKKKYEIDFNTTLGAGMYILVLETEQQTLVKKIIIY